jgi:hypothetical protein
MPTTKPPVEKVLPIELAPDVWRDLSAIARLLKREPEEYVTELVRAHLNTIRRLAAAIGPEES